MKMVSLGGFHVLLTLSSVQRIHFDEPKSRETIGWKQFCFQIYLDDNKSSTNAVLILTQLSTKYIMKSSAAFWIKVDSFWLPVQVRSKTSYSVPSSSFLKRFGKKTGPMTLRNGTQDFIAPHGFYYLNFPP